MVLELAKGQFRLPRCVGGIRVRMFVLKKRVHMARAPSDNLKRCGFVGPDAAPRYYYAARNVISFNSDQLLGYGTSLRV
jgi:hypothetical protein